MENVAFLEAATLEATFLSSAGNGRSLTRDPPLRPRERGLAPAQWALCRLVRSCLQVWQPVTELHWSLSGQYQGQVRSGPSHSNFNFNPLTLKGGAAKGSFTEHF